MFSYNLTTISGVLPHVVAMNQTDCCTALEGEQYR